MRKLEKSPQVISVALPNVARALLSGEENLVPPDFHNYEFSKTFHIHDGNVRPDQERKSFISGVRAIACIDLTSALHRAQSSIPRLSLTSSDKVDLYSIYPITRRSIKTFELLQQIMDDSMNGKVATPHLDKVFTNFKHYIAFPQNAFDDNRKLAMFRRVVIQRLREEDFTKIMLPAYLKLIYEVGSRYYVDFSYRQYRSLALASGSFLLRLLNQLERDLQGYFLTFRADGTESLNGYILDPSKFEVVQSNANGQEKIKPRAEIETLLRKKIGMFREEMTHNAVKTGCPAIGHVDGVETSLIHTLLELSLPE